MNMILALFQFPSCDIKLLVAHHIIVITAVLGVVYNVE